MPSILIQSQTPLLIVLHLLTAGAVTIHVLMNKREAAAAIGWIGLAWLSPFLGALLYTTFGVNRVKRRARRLRDGLPRSNRPETGDILSFAPIEELKKAVAGITGENVEPGNYISHLYCGDEAYPRMLAAIEEAKLSIALSSYIFRDDEIGGKFIEALVRAQNRGVQVRVLIDGFGGGLFRSPAYRRLCKLGVPAARFLRSAFPWRMPLLNLRLHKKLLVADVRVAFAGGLNIGAENQSSLRRTAPVRDVHFYIEGPVVSQIVADFRDDWLLTTAESLDGPAWSQESVSQGQAQARVIPSGPDQEIDQLVLVLLSAINSARTSIKIATPYFLPDEQLVTALQLAALRGVDVHIVIPSRSNHWLVTCAAQAHIGPLLASGCHVWLGVPPFDHSKLMTVDGEWSLIGSPNWDTRSLRLNFELAIEIYDRGMAVELATIIDKKCIAPLTTAALGNRLFIVKLRDAAARLFMPYL